MSKPELLCQSCRAAGGCGWPPVAKDDYCRYYDPDPRKVKDDDD